MCGKTTGDIYTLLFAARERHGGQVPKPFGDVQKVQQFAGSCQCDCLVNSTFQQGFGHNDFGGNARYDAQKLRDVTDGGAAQLQDLVGC